VTSGRFARSLLGSLALGAPFVLAAHAASAFVAPLTSATVAALLCVTTPLAAVASAGPDADAFTPDAPTDEAPLAVGEAATQSPAHGSAKTRPKSAAAGAVFVSKATVLELAKSPARPRGSFVSQTPEHPAGLRLWGVSALGIGVQDGDVLIEALGATPRSPGQVIAAIIEARAKQPRFLSGTLFRHGQRVPITVEQPYVVATAVADSSGPEENASRHAP